MAVKGFEHFNEVPTRYIHPYFILTLFPIIPLLPARPMSYLDQSRLIELTLGNRSMEHKIQTMLIYSFTIQIKKLRHLENRIKNMFLKIRQAVSLGC